MFFGTRMLRITQIYTDILHADYMDYAGFRRFYVSHKEHKENPPYPPLQRGESYADIIQI